MSYLISYNTVHNYVYIHTISIALFPDHSSPPIVAGTDGTVAGADVRRLQHRQQPQGLQPVAALFSCAQSCNEALEQKFRWDLGLQFISIYGMCLGWLKIHWIKVHKQTICKIWAKKERMIWDDWQQPPPIGPRCQFFTKIASKRLWETWINLASCWCHLPACGSPAALAQRESCPQDGTLLVYLLKKIKHGKGTFNKQ